MIFPTKSTKWERRVISNAMWPIFTGLEQAQTLLNTCLEEHFESSPQKAITESEAAWLADMLHIVNTSLEDAIASFKLTVGWRHGVEWLEKSTEEHRQVMDLDAIANEISDIHRSLPVEYRGPIADEPFHARRTGPAPRGGTPMSALEVIALLTLVIAAVSLGYQIKK